MRRNYRVSWFHFHWVHCSSISVVVFLWGPWFFFNRIKPLWGQHPSRSPLLISSRGTDVRTAVSNGCASQEWSCGFNPYVKYVTLDIIGYKKNIYIHIYLFIYTCFFVEPVYEVGLGLQMSRTAAGTTVSFRVSLRTCWRNLRPPGSLELRKQRAVGPPWLCLLL